MRPEPWRWIVGIGIGAAAAAALVSSEANGNIDLEFRPQNLTVFVGETFDIELWAVSDDVSDQSLSAIDAIFAWDAGFLDFEGLTGANHPSVLSEGFPEDPHGLNEANPPQDGDGFYVMFASLGDPILATPAGTMITTFAFTAVAPTDPDNTFVDLLRMAGAPEGQTRVYSGETPNKDVTGALMGAKVTILVPGPAASALLVMGLAARTRRRRT